MAKKSFKSDTPLDNFDTVPVTQSEDVQVAAVEPKAEPKAPATKKKVGRPKTKDVKGTCKNINVAVPIILLDQWEEVKIVHGSNLTAYITKLIEKDMEANYSTYKNIADSLKNF